jgi:hypothetical protein
MDFVSDGVSTGKVIQMLTIVDDCTRECPVIEVDTSPGGLRVRACWIGSRRSEDCRKRSLWTMGAWASAGGLERRTWCAVGVCALGQAGTERLRRKLQRSTARQMPECELVHESERRTTKDRNLAAGLQRATSSQFVELPATRRFCTHAGGDAGMMKATTGMLEQRTQTVPCSRPHLR